MLARGEYLIPLSRALILLDYANLSFSSLLSLEIVSDLSAARLVKLWYGN